MPHTSRHTPVWLRPLVIAAAVITTLAAVAPSARAASTTYYDCRHCVDDPAPLYPTSTCQYPSSGYNGYTVCRQQRDAYGSLCWDGTTPCLYYCTGPGCDTSGGGGGDTGGGGGSCGSATYCPPSCFDCGGQYY